MKKVLVIGAAGSIGIYVIKYLLSESKYEITALDMKNKKVKNTLKKYRNRLNIVYGDICDYVLIEALVKDQDYIIDLASVMPPLGDFSKTVGEEVDYKGIENILKAINYYNPKCFLIYASTTSLYKDKEEVTVKDKINKDSLSNYELNKYKTERLIKEKGKNYTIFRLPIVLTNIRNETFTYNVKKDKIVEVITNYDAAYAFVKALNYSKELNRRIFNLGMGSNGRILYSEILRNILNNYGLSWRYILSRLFLEKTFTSPILLDSDELENIIHYQNDTLYNYYRRLQNKNKKRKIAKLLAKLVVTFKNKGR